MLRPRPHHARLPLRTLPRRHRARLPLRTSPRLGRLPLPTLPHRMLPRRRRSSTAGVPPTPQQRERLRNPQQDASRPLLALLVHPRPTHGTRRARAPPRRSKRMVPAPPPAAKRDRSWPNPAQARKRRRRSRLGATTSRARLRARVPPRASVVRKTRRRKINRTEPSKRQAAIEQQSPVAKHCAIRSLPADPALTIRALARWRAPRSKATSSIPNGGFVRRAPS